MWFYAKIVLIGILSFGGITCGLAYVGSKNIGLMIAGWIYWAGAIAVYKLDTWWPFPAVYAALWVLRLIGLDPSWKRGS
jgi:hypothetical protein